MGLRNKFKGRTRNELILIRGQRLSERRSVRSEVRTVRKALNIKTQHLFQLFDSVRELNEEIGYQQGNGCPAVKEEDVLNWTCRAKRYAHNSWNESNLFTSRCSHCKLTHDEARIAMDYDKILNGRRRKVR